MSTLKEVLDRLKGALVTVEEAEGGRLRLRTWLEEYPITAELTDLCREHKPLLLEYVRWEDDADKLLIESTNRLSAIWPQGCDALDNDSAWDELESRIHQAYWSMDRVALVSAIETREAYVRQVFNSHRGPDNEVKQ